MGQQLPPQISCRQLTVFGAPRLSSSHRLASHQLYTNPIVQSPNPPHSSTGFRESEQETEARDEVVDETQKLRKLRVGNL